MGRPKNSKNKIDHGIYCTCLYCGKSYRIRPYRMSTSNFCSVSCCSKYYYDSKLKNKSPKIPWNKNKKTGLVPKSAFKPGTIPWNKGISMYPEYKQNYLRAIHKPEIIEKHRQHRLHQVFPLKDTVIEVKLQNILSQNNIEFETHYPVLGQPDIFIKPNLCIFADGDYWHSLPRALTRDPKITAHLRRHGYRVLRFKEHEIHRDIQRVLRVIVSKMSTNKSGVK